MARRKWRGHAEFELPEGMRCAVMTVCPGEPRQEGQKFLAIMNAAAQKLDQLLIVEAADLGQHNVKRFLPGSLALEFARLRGQKWQEEHQPMIDDTMGKRCTVVPMRAIVGDLSFNDRVAAIRAIYDRGGNPVTSWFDYSADLDVKTRQDRLKDRGVIMEPWAIRANSLDYLCAEYAMRSLMWQKWGLDEIYLGLAVQEPDFFQKENNGDASLDLTIPKVHSIQLKEHIPVLRRGRGPGSGVQDYVVG